MSRGRARLEWDQTAILWCQQANLNRDPENPETKKPFLPSDIHPYRTSKDYEPDEQGSTKPTHREIPKTLRVRSLGKR